jgi:GT2 family glycosyltransferase
MIDSKICYVIVTYETELAGIKKLLDCFGNRQIYLIDNTQNRDKQIITYCQNENLILPRNIKLITNRENLGYAAGVNVGLKMAIRNGFIWATVLNDDIKISQILLKEYEKQLNNVKSGITGLFPGTLNRARFTTILPGLKNSKNDYLSGSFWSIHKDVIEKIGYLNERYFLYYEEVEYCLKAVKSGFNLTEIMIPEITHSNEPRIGKNSFMHQYYLARNHLLFVSCNAPLDVKLHEFFRFPKTLYLHIQKGEWGAVKGITDYIWGIFGKYKGAIC